MTTPKPQSPRDIESSEPASSKGIRVVWMSRTNAPNVIHHLEPLLEHPEVMQVTVVRHEPIP
ncbi:MAG: hypothetical protein HQL53_14695, partial [Magnetococcales bacterium]|nr:hypothetical protein [Magnetococcales bacterium]